MELSKLSALGWKHTQNAAAEEIYLRTGYDSTKPVTFYGLVNEHCNVKAREIWYGPKAQEIRRQTLACEAPGFG